MWEVHWQAMGSMGCLSTCRECLLSDGGSVRSTAGLWVTPLYAVVGDLEQ